MSNQIQLHERALYSYCTRSGRQRTNPSRKRFSNFPRASYLDERTLTYEPIVNFSSACSSNWVGMYVWVTIDKSYWKRIELITNSASKVRVYTLRGARMEMKCPSKFHLKCSNTAMVKSMTSLCNLLSLWFCRPLRVATWPLTKSLRKRGWTQSSLSQISLFWFCLNQSYRKQNGMHKIFFARTDI